jgi:hypothetical protein
MMSVEKAALPLAVLDAGAAHAGVRFATIAGTTTCKENETKTNEHNRERKLALEANLLRQGKIFSFFRCSSVPLVVKKKSLHDKGYLKNERVGECSSGESGRGWMI